MSFTGGLPASAPLLALVVVVSLAAVGPAGAQDDQTRARDLFAEGRRDVARGDLEAACDKFAQSHALAPDAVGPLLNLADCDERAGKVATAWRRLARAVELADDEEQRAYAQRRVEALADRVPRLTLERPAEGSAEITVERDGEPADVGDSGEERALDPGRYIVVVRASGRSDRRYEIDLREGEDRTAVLELGPALAPAPSPSPAPSLRAPPPPLPPPMTPRDDGSSSFAVAGWVVGGIGVAAISVGIATGIAVGVNAGIYDDHCDAQDRCDAEGLAAAERGKPLAVVSPVMLTLGLVGIGVALPLLLIDDDDTGVQVTFTPRGVTVGAAF